MIIYRGSREYIDPSMSYHSDYHKGPIDDEDDEEYTDDEEEYGKDAYDGPPPTTGYNPNTGVAPPSYNVYAEKSHPTSSGQYVQGVEYQPPTSGDGIVLQEPNRSQASDTFVWDSVVMSTVVSQTERQHFSYNIFSFGIGDEQSTLIWEKMLFV